MRRLILCFLPVLCLLLLSGCASRFERVLEETRTVEEARAYFGQPTGQATLPGGNVRYEWALDSREHVPGQWVTREEYSGYHDRDGYPITITRRFFVSEHYVDHHCRLVIVTGPQGGVVSSRWTGNSCDRLLRGMPQGDAANIDR